MLFDLVLLALSYLVLCCVFLSCLVFSYRTFERAREKEKEFRKGGWEGGRKRNPTSLHFFFCVITDSVLLLK